MTQELTHRPCNRAYLVAELREVGSATQWKKIQYGYVYDAYAGDGDLAIETAAELHEETAYAL